MITNAKETLDEMKMIYNWRNGTRTTYGVALKDYITYQNTSFKELIQEAEKEEETIRKTSKRTIKNRLLRYRLHMQEKGKSQNTIKMYLAMITKVYRYLDIEIPRLPPIRVTTTETYNDIPTSTEISTAILHARTKNKALISFIASSGLRRSDVASLTIQDFLDATREYHNTNNIFEAIPILKQEPIVVPTWNITGVKTNINHITFSSHESSIYILQMLSENILKTYNSNDDLLFNMKPDSISKNFRALNEKLEMGWKQTRRHFHPHALRKYFATTLTSNDVDYLSTQFMLGHSLSQVDSSYYFANPERLKHKYLRVMDSLTFTMKVEYIDVNSREKRELAELRQYKAESNQRINQLEEMVNFLSKEI